MNMPSVRVKVCGITRPEDGLAAAEAGAAFVGTVLSPGFGRSVTPSQALEIHETAGVVRVGVVVDPDEAWLLAVARELSLDVVQLHGGEAPDFARRVADAGAWRVWKAIHVSDVAQAAEAAAPYSQSVQGVLLDTAHLELPGGTGERFHWGPLDELRGVLDGHELIAAGGLHPDNVAEAVRLLRPDVVDVSSGVERSPGQKDAEAIGRFIAAVRSAFPSKHEEGAR